METNCDDCRCPKCGLLNPPDARWCVFCGPPRLRRKCRSCGRVVSVTELREVNTIHGPRPYCFNCREGFLPFDGKSIKV